MAAGHPGEPNQKTRDVQEARNGSGNLTTRITESIRRSILDAEYQLGEALSEAMLAEKYGVSRTPVREALTELQRQGLIVIRQQAGSFVFMPSEEDVAELCEFRRMIEVTAIRLAYARRPAETLTQMREAIAAMKNALESEDQLGYAHADSDFHGAGVENCANHYLIEAYKLVSGRLEALRSHNLTNWQKLRNKITTEHRAVVAAFEKGDLMQVEEVVDAHISRMASTFRVARHREAYARTEITNSRKARK